MTEDEWFILLLLGKIFIFSKEGTENLELPFEMEEACGETFHLDVL